jgi:hypothetical protein
MKNLCQFTAPVSRPSSPPPTHRTQTQSPDSALRVLVRLHRTRSHFSPGVIPVLLNIVRPRCVCRRHTRTRYALSGFSPVKSIKIATGDKVAISRFSWLGIIVHSNVSVVLRYRISIASAVCLKMPRRSPREDDVRQVIILSGYILFLKNYL